MCVPNWDLTETSPIHRMLMLTSRSPATLLAVFVCCRPIRTRKCLYLTLRPSKPAGCDFHKTTDKRRSLRHHDSSDALLCSVLLDAGNQLDSSCCCARSMTERNISHATAAALVRQMGPNERSLVGDEIERIASDVLRVTTQRAVYGINDLCCPRRHQLHQTYSLYTKDTTLFLYLSLRKFSRY